MRPRRIIGAVAVAVLTASMLSASPVNAEPRATAPAKAQPRLAAARTVTLITGDRVSVHGVGHYAITPRKGIQFLRYSAGTRSYVIPSDALPLIRSNRLDLRLFDINGLLEAGYDKRGSLPLIITGSPSARAVAPPGLKISRQLPAVGGYAASGTAPQLKGYWESLKGLKTARTGSEKIWLDGIRKPVLDVSVPQIGAPAAWQAGLDGTGVKVAVLDTGIDSAHPDLAGKVIAAQNFAAEAEDDLDHVGHGTHVASTIAGTGAASGGKYKGVAPGASLLNGKVCAQFGCAESWILAGMQWAAESGAQVVNMSLGGTDEAEIDPLEAAVNELTAQYGTLFVIAAGNSGFGGSYTLGSPASADAALAVGAVYKNDTLAEFSSRGPRTGDAAVKPEITAPGVEITAAMSKDSGGPAGQSYVVGSGTSMATPHVAGAAAIVTQQHPQWTANQRKTALTGSASPTATDGPFEQGAGRVDVARAITAAITVAESTVSFGVQTFPHGDDPVQVKDVTYHNAGTADVTLQLALSNAAGGIFSLSASTLTVPAGGSAKVSLTSDTRQGTALGPLGGRLTATADGVRVQVAYGVDREDQKFNVDLTHTAGSSEAADFFYFTVVINLDSGKDYVLSGDTSSPTQVRVPSGTYLIFTWLDEISAEGEHLRTTQLMWPKLTITADRAVALDARLGGKIDITVPDPAALPDLIAAAGNVEYNGRSISVSIAGGLGSLYTGHLGPKPVAGVSATVQGIFELPPAPGETDSTVMYNLAWVINDGTFPTGFTRHVTKQELATVKYSIAKHATDLGEVLQFAEIPGGAWAIGIPTTLPGKRIDYLTGGITYNGEFNELAFGENPWPDRYSTQIAAPTAYPAGKTTNVRYNDAVFGTAFPQSVWQDAWLTRHEDTLYLSPPLFSDSGGHAGFGNFTNARTALYRNGVLVGEDPLPYALFPVPSEQSTYRVESLVERGAPARLSTKVATTWTFKSAHVNGWGKLPVSAVGFQPQLSDENTARAGAIMLIPAKISQQAGAKPVRTIAVDVSTNDGTTWSKATVISILGVHFVLLKNPGTAGFVSLRSSATDTGGNSVSQTIIRAYEVK